MLKKRLSIIIPAHNEAGNIKAVVKKVSLILPKYCSNYQIIIINDGILIWNVNINSQTVIEK